MDYFVTARAKACYFAIAKEGSARVERIGCVYKFHAKSRKFQQQKLKRDEHQLEKKEIESPMNIKRLKVKAGRFAARLPYCIIALVLISVCPPRVLAQEGHEHEAAPDSHHMNPEQRKRFGELVKIVRESTERFKDVSVAEAEGYALQFGCVSGPDSGAMGLHYVNAELVNSGVLDATHPQIVIYEARPNGSLRLIGADYLLLADAWNKTHSGPPKLMGQLFHLFDSPNRFGLPAFYTLHVWAWKENPNGAFVNWHPNVSCEFFNGQNP